MKSIATINFNDFVYVKLTEVGRAELVRIHDRRNESMRKVGGTLLEGVGYKIDEQGYTKFMVWSLMHDLGHLCGMACPEPFESAMLFEVDE